MGAIGIWYFEQQQLMLIVHKILQFDNADPQNMMLRASNSIHTQAHKPNSNDEKLMFSDYVLTYVNFTQHHHEGETCNHMLLTWFLEEIFFFRECEKRVPGPMKVDMDRYPGFHTGLEEMETYFRQVQKDSSTYDEEKVINLLHKFGDILTEYMCHEIQTLAPENMERIFADPKEAKDIADQIVKLAMSNSAATASEDGVRALGSSIAARRQCWGCQVFE